MNTKEPTGILGTLRKYTPISWFHDRGRYRVLARLEPKLPDVTGNLFLTFTIDPAQFASPREGFDKANDKLRKVFYALRKGVEWEGKFYQIDAPYGRKLEFHENGWPHFHVILRTRRYVPNELISHLWNLGYTDTKRIKNEDFRYLLKYVTKGGGELPEWVGEMNRIRIWQTSPGFYVETKDEKTEDENNDDNDDRPATDADIAKMREKPPIKRKETTIAERIENWRKTALYKQGETYRQITLWDTFDRILDILILPIALAGRYLGDGQIAIKQREELIPWILKPNPV